MFAVLKRFVNLVSVLLAVWGCAAQASSAVHSSGETQIVELVASDNQPLPSLYGAAVISGRYVFMSAFAESPTLATEDVLKQCRAKVKQGVDCTVKFTFKDQCAVVMAEVRTDKYFWYVGKPGMSSDETELQGLRNCYSEAGSVCQRRGSRCSTHAQQELSKSTEEFFEWLKKPSDRGSVQ